MAGTSSGLHLILGFEKKYLQWFGYIKQMKE
jgi:hypothetical protein